MGGGPGYNKKWGELFDHYDLNYRHPVFGQEEFQPSLLTTLFTADAWRAHARNRNFHDEQTIPPETIISLHPPSLNEKPIKSQLPPKISSKL